MYSLGRYAAKRPIGCRGEAPRDANADQPSFSAAPLGQTTGILLSGPTKINR
jgi:hypothetical protein